MSRLRANEVGEESVSLVFTKSELDALEGMLFNMWLPSDKSHAALRRVKKIHNAKETLNASQEGNGGTKGNSRGA